MKDRRLEPAWPELERRLIASAATRVQARPSLGRRLAARRGTRIAALGLACLAFGGSAMAAGVWSPGIGTDAPFEGNGSPLSGEGPVQVSLTPVPAAAVDSLGVLRREQTDQDRSAEVEATLADVSFVDRVRPDSVRFLAAGERGQATILLSAERSIDTDIEHSPEEPICVFRPGAFGYGHMVDVQDSCSSVSDLLAGRAYSQVLNDPLGQGLAFGLVPDGVASITAEFLDAPDVTVAVRDNYFEIPLSGPQVGEGKGDLKGGVQRVIWHDASGNVVPQRPNGKDVGRPISSIERILINNG